MIINKEEFKTLVMLYAANMDGNIQPEEMKVMLENSGSNTVEKIEKLFAKMNDAEVLDFIRENKEFYADTKAKRLELIRDCCAVIAADEKCTAMEEQMLRTLSRLLE